MHLTSWIAFTIAYTLMALAPGPVILLVVSYALSRGRRTAFAVVAGTSLGDATGLTAATLGVGALIAASATAFLVLKLAGAAYLIILGIRLWRTPPVAENPPQGDSAGAEGRWRIFLHAYLTTALNPKSVLFFMVFVPQFMDPKTPLAPQLAAMLMSVLACGALVDGSYSVFAASLRRFIRAPKAQRGVNRVAGGILIAEGAYAAVARAT